MTTLEQKRLIEKSVSIGQINELERNEAFIGLSQIAPFKNVDSDDVIFQTLGPSNTSLAPARAQDAEAELYERDDFAGHGRASVVDWSLKDRYTSSDVKGYRNYLEAAKILGANGLPPGFASNSQKFQAMLSRDAIRRRSDLDNRLEWLIMTGAFTNNITYNDGKVIFTVNYDRPASQQNQPPTSGLWSLTTSDPIGDLITMNTTMYNLYGVKMDKGYTSEKVLMNLVNSERFKGLTGMVGAAGSAPVDPNYLLTNWGYKAAQQIIEQATSIKLFPYDAIYRTRALGSTTTTVERFSTEEDILFMPPQSFINEIASLDEIGFAATLTAPHAENNWQPGFYEWEDSERDPWQHVRGTGIMAFPVFPHLKYTYTMTVL